MYGIRQTLRAMKAFLKRIPLPLCGVALALAALGSLLETRLPLTYPICGFVSAAFVLLFLGKCVLHPRMIASDLDNPVLGAVAGTFPMALMNLSTYLARFSWYGGFALWLIGVALFFALMVRYTWRQARNTPLLQLTPAYFVIYLGYQGASITAPTFHAEAFGLALSVIGIIVTPFLVIAVTMRFVGHRPLPGPQTPLLCIFSAPFGMALASYLACAAHPSFALATTLFAFATAGAIVGFALLIPSLRTPFSPTYAAMTFPFVISTAASLQYAALATSALNGAGSYESAPLALIASFAQGFSALQIVVATILVACVVARFVVSLAKQA